MYNVVRWLIRWLIIPHSHTAPRLETQMSCSFCVYIFQVYSLQLVCYVRILMWCSFFTHARTPTRTHPHTNTHVHTPTCAHPPTHMCTHMHTDMHELFSSSGFTCGSYEHYVHDWVGGQMDDVPSAVIDPIFNYSIVMWDHIFESWLPRFAQGHAFPELPAYVTVSEGPPWTQPGRLFSPFCHS